eukprot:7142555-Prorocentrum_lima.AAC.1
MPMGDKNLDVMIEAPEILSRLGTVKRGTAWKIRRRVRCSKGDCRARCEECERALGDLIWYADYWKSNVHLVKSRMHP